MITTLPNKFICVGDLHGDLMLYRLIKHKFQGIPIIQLGDLLDSFKFSRSEQVKLLEEVLDDIESDKIIGLLGNHELSYLYPENMKCSGFSGTMHTQIIPFKYKMHKLMKHFILDTEKKILITHAGLSTLLISDIKELDIANFLDTESKKLFDGIIYNIGRGRGGSSKVGGIFWCDFFTEFMPIEDIIQIFGHTPISEIRNKNNNFNIDCLQRVPQVLKYENGVFETITL